jgi:hypothetical protein
LDKTKIVAIYFKKIKKMGYPKYKKIKQLKDAFGCQFLSVALFEKTQPIKKIFKCFMAVQLRALNGILCATIRKKTLFLWIQNP